MSWFFERWCQSLLNEKLWPNFFSHRHHQGQGGDFSPFTHSPNVGGSTPVADERFAPSTDPPNLLKAMFTNPHMRVSLFQPICCRGEGSSFWDLLRFVTVSVVFVTLSLIIHTRTFSDTTQAALLCFLRRKDFPPRVTPFMGNILQREKKQPHTQQRTSTKTRVTGIWSSHKRVSKIIHKITRLSNMSVICGYSKYGILFVYSCLMVISHLIFCPTQTATKWYPKMMISWKKSFR